MAIPIQRFEAWLRDVRRTTVKIPAFFERSPNIWLYSTRIP